MALIFLTACENDDHVPEFTLRPASGEVVFQNTFSAEYLLSSQTGANIAERFVWNEVDFGVPTEVSYRLEGSISENFDADGLYQFDSGTLNTNNASVNVGQLLTMAEGLGLDNDPATTDDEGNPNNSGTVYFKVSAFPGSGQGSDASATVSEVVELTVVIIEKSLTGGSAFEISSWGVVGNGYNDWGAFPDSPFYTTSSSGVLVAYAKLLDGEIKFRENNAWDSDLGDNDTDGTLEPGGANIPVTAGDYKITLDLNDNTYTLEAFSWGVVGDAYNDWGGTGPDAKFHYDYTTDTFRVGVKLNDGQMKFRMNNAWNTDFGDTGADGTLDAGGDNLTVTAGYYTIALDFNAGTYTMEETDLWGVVGSGYNEWGGAGPDFTFTEVNPGIWVAEDVTLIDGMIKFRINEAWDTDYGDTGADGTLDAGGEDIAVSAGTYIIVLDLSNEGSPTYLLNLRLGGL